MSHLGRFSKAPRVARESYGRRSERPEKPDWGPSREARGIDFLYGIQSVTGALSANKRKVYGLWMKSDFSKAMERTSKMERIVELYQKVSGHLPFERSTEELSSLVSGQPHQGVVMEVSLLDPPVLTELTSKEATASPHRKNALWIALDEIQDPQNMGAIIRTCVYFGIDGIITTEVKSAPLNSTVSKASAGALEVAPIFYPGNLGQFLENSKENGWRVIGTSLEEHSKSADSTNLQMDKPTILVLGNEAKGLRHRIKNLCDYHVKLEPVGAAGEVESLNVSVATALLVHPMATCPSNKKGGSL